MTDLHASRAHGPVASAPLDTTSPHLLWVLSAQLTLQVALFLGFGVLPLPSPNLVAGATLALAAATLALAPHGLIGRVRLNLVTVSVVWWWLLSVLWSADTGQWWIDSMSNLPILLAVVVIAGVLPTHRTVGALVGFVHLTVAFQVVWIATHPSTATANRDLLTGAMTAGWRGSFIHKNALGPFLVVALLTVALLEHRRTLRWCTVTIGLGLLVMTRSVTAWWVAIAIGGLVTWLVWYAGTSRRTRPAVVLPSLTAGAIMLVGLARVYPIIVDAYGKDLTFSGRTAIWASALEAIGRRPVTGYGIGGVWFRPNEEPARSIIADAGFTVFHTHNGYLELLLLLGGVGLALWLWLATSTLVAAWRALDVDRPLALWGVTVTATVLLVSFAEVLVFGSWLALVVVARLLVDRRRAPTAHATDGGR